MDDTDGLEAVVVKDEKAREVLTTLIAWIAQSANAPISVADATRLINRLNDGQG